jgi:hypothetical protein
MILLSIIWLIERLRRYKSSVTRFTQIFFVVNSIQTILKVYVKLYWMKLVKMLSSRIKSSNRNILITSSIRLIMSLCYYPIQVIWTQTMNLWPFLLTIHSTESYLVLRTQNFIRRYGLYKRCVQSSYYITISLSMLAIS